VHAALDGGEEADASVLGFALGAIAAMPFTAALASAAPCQLAAAYIARHWSVFPLQPRSKVPYPGTRGFKNASTDAVALLRWPADANVGIATGAGLVVIDVDDVHGGGDSLHALEREHGQLPVTPSVKTPNGMHYYLRARSNVACSAGQLGPGLDVRGDGGYIVAPPSIHPNGRCYEWDVEPGEVPLAVAPSWLVEPPAARGARADSATWVTMIRGGCADGERNTGLTRLVGHLLARGVHPRVVLELAHAVNARNRPPLAEREVEQVVKSIWGREVRK
jgi:Bifunctional DNA primase/polymerase, N-terminal/Primase C terminal 1 (PriCT-1)